MLGLLNEWPGLGLTAPGKLGVDAHDLAEAVEQAFKPGATSVQGTPGLSPERRKALAGAAEQACRLKTSRAGQEHPLLLPLREGDALPPGASRYSWYYGGR